MYIRTSVPMLVVLLLLCGCNETRENTDTRFLMDTVITLTADCDDAVLEEAFSRCEEYEKKFSRTDAESEVSRLNSSGDKIAVSSDTRQLIERSVYYGDLSSGKFDITVYPVSILWDYKNEVIPSRNEIAEALKNVDYHSIICDSDGISTGNAAIDLGGIAKGYIADRLREFFAAEGVRSGLINLGGNIVSFGDEGAVIGIRKPFCDNELSARVKIKNTSIVTSGIYERCFTKKGVLYHHIIDPDTGYPADTDLASATVICDCSEDADALATVCVLSGSEKALSLIEETDGAEAVLIDRDGKMTYSSGLYREEDMFLLKENKDK